MKAPAGLVALTVAVLSLFVLATVSDVHAQAVPVQTEIKAITGRVEVLRQGQSQWRPASVGMKLADGDQIRAWAAASAELELPDASTVVLSENSRLVVTKVAVDTQNRNRVGIFHLAVGKVKASLAQSAIQLVQARQSNFAITTPGGVAAARGTIFVVGYDAITSQTMVAVVRGQVVFIDCVTGNFRNISINNYVTQTGGQPPSEAVSTTALPPAVLSALTGQTNPTTANQGAISGAPPSACADLIQVVSLLSRAGLSTPPSLVSAPPPPATTTNPDTISSVGRDQLVCTSEPCPR